MNFSVEIHFQFSLKNLHGNKACLLTQYQTDDLTLNLKCIFSEKSYHITGHYPIKCIPLQLVVYFFNYLDKTIHNC